MSGRARTKTEKDKLERFATQLLASDKAVFRVKETAAILRCSHPIVRKLVRDGLLPRVGATRTILIPRAALLRWLEAGAPSPSTVAEAERTLRAAEA